MYNSGSDKRDTLIIPSIKNTQVSYGKGGYDVTSRSTLVFEDKNLKGGFTQIPNIVLRNPVISPGGKVLYGLLLSHAWQDKECFPGQDSLCDSMGLTKRTLIRILKELVKAKLITIERRGQGLVNIYHICNLSNGYIPMKFIDKGNR